MRFRVAHRTDVGLVRSNNQDASYAEHPLYAVADGMGGHKGGEVASDLSLEVLAGWRERIETDGPERLREAVLDANRAVFQRGGEDPDLSGMGTTLTAGWIQDDTVTVAHVGDSRAYLLRGDTLSRLTEDQTLVAEWEREGKIEPGEADFHPQRNILRQAIGSETELEVDMTTVELRGGDRLLITSDGLHGVVRDDERIKGILSGRRDPDGTCEELIELAKEAGGRDNITVLLVDVLGDEGEAVPSDDAVAPIIVSKPSSGRRRRLRGRVRQVAIGLSAVVLAAIVVALFVLRSAEPSWLVGTSGEHVALLRGSPGEDREPPDAEVVHVYRRVPLESIARTSRQDLRSGIPVGSRREAERVVATLPRVLGPEETPSPSPSPPEPSPTPPASPVAP